MFSKFILAYIQLYIYVFICIYILIYIYIYIAWNRSTVKFCLALKEFFYPIFQLSLCIESCYKIFAQFLPSFFFFVLCFYAVIWVIWECFYTVSHCVPAQFLLTGYNVDIKQYARSIHFCIDDFLCWYMLNLIISSPIWQDNT